MRKKRDITYRVEQYKSDGGANGFGVISSTHKEMFWDPSEAEAKTECDRLNRVTEVKIEVCDKNTVTIRIDRYGNPEIKSSIYAKPGKMKLYEQAIDLLEYVISMHEEDGIKVRREKYLSGIAHALCRAIKH